VKASAWLATLWVCLAPSSSSSFAFGQQSPLGPTVHSFAEQFASINSIRELPNGDVIVSDDRDNRLVVVRRGGSALTIGGQGLGPGEYMQVTRLLAMGSDSTLMYDPKALRWLIVVGSRVAYTVRAEAPAMRLALGSQGPRGIDGTGRVLAIVLSLTDSLAVVTLPRSGVSVDTIARVAPLSPRYLPRLSAGVHSGFNAEILDFDQAVVSSDGAIAIAHAQPFRVDWCSRSSCMKGPVLEPSRPMTPSERVKYLAMLQLKTGRQPPKNIVEVTGWPDVLPGFVQEPGQRDGSPLFATPDGRAVIHRFTPGSSLNTYQIVNRRGRSDGIFIVPLRERVVGFGAHSIYLAATDSDGIERLTMRSWR
jgi:hypothetical protein